MDANTEREILTQEEDLTQATRQLDIDTLDRMYADDIMFTGVTGYICDKSALMGEARRGVTERESAAKSGPAVISYDKEDIRIVAHGDTAVASYRFVITIQNAGQEITRRYRTTNVWMKRMADGRSSLRKPPVWNWTYPNSNNPKNDSNRAVWLVPLDLGIEVLNARAHLFGRDDLRAEMDFATEFLHSGL